ncbi:hypothetical protein D5045_15785 [Verminephrobacter eiseniae]|nr:hypothetical protein [Verminephrobacter eiseniae]
MTRHLAYTFTSENDEVMQVSYAQLLQRALQIGTAVCEYTRRGDRVILMVSPGIDYVASFLSVRLQTKVCRVCGSHPAAWANGPKAASVRACAGWWGMGKVRTWVRTGFAGLHSVRTKNGQARKLNAGAGLQLI